MRIVNISDVLQYTAGETVPSVRGLVAGIFARTTGQNSNGDWSFQNLTLKDSTGEIKVKLKDCDELPLTLKGKQVILSCNEGQHGLTGVKAQDDEYRGKVSRILWVTKSHHIEVVDGQQQQAPATRQSEPPPQSAPARQPAHDPVPAPVNGNGHDQKAVKLALNKYANLYLHCLEAGLYVRSTFDAAHHQEQTVMTDDQFQACVSAIFIQATRDFLAGSVETGKFAK